LKNSLLIANPIAGEVYVYAKVGLGGFTSLWQKQSDGTETDLAAGGASGANQQLSNLAATVAVNRSLIFNTTTDQMAAADFGVGMFNTTTLDVKAGSGGTINFRQATSTKMILSSSALAMQTATELQMGDNDITQIKALEFNDNVGFPANTLEWIQYDSPNLTFNVGTTADGYVFNVVGVTKLGIGNSVLNFNALVEMNSANIDMNNNDIVGCDQITWTDGPNINANTTEFNIVSGAQSRDIKFSVGSNPTFEMGEDTTGYFQVESQQAGLAPEIRILNDYTAISDDDPIGIINFNGWDSSDIVAQWLSIRVEAADVTSSSKDSLVEFWIHSANSAAAANVVGFAME
jgi:hypothetical protein